MQAEWFWGEALKRSKNWSTWERMRSATLPRSSATLFTAPALARVSSVAVPTRFTS
jgi:hypothetical protein